MQPRFPIYIVSKGRWDSRLTVKCLEQFKTPYHIIVEEQELESYAKVIDPAKILVLDPEYQRTYDIFEDIGVSGRTGSGPARNFAWDHAKAHGAEFHWTIDDNIRGFYRTTNNTKIPADTTVMRCMEDFVLRYENVSMAGPQYYMFLPRKYKIRNPFVLNTRIYSCNLIRTDAPFRWRGRYNEDTDLSLRMLKDGWCTIQFNAFLQWKEVTQSMKGGNTDTIYVGGTLPKSQMLVNMHPDVAKLKWRFGRWHHMVDYSGFTQPLILKKEQPAPTDYGFHIVPRVSGRAPQPFSKSGKQLSPFQPRTGELKHKLMQGAGVPGGHHCIYVGDRKPMVPNLKEANSIPLRHSDVVVDIGAFVGTFAIKAARFPVLKATAYEPTPYSFEVMSQQRGVNLELRQMAVVGDDRKQATFYVGEGYGPTNSLFESRNKNRREVTVPCINYVEAVRGATVVKLDIEGGEYDLPILQPSVRAYAIDFHKTTQPEYMAKALAIIAELEQAGFKCLVAPGWTTGLDRAGAWVRELPDDGRACEQLLRGKACTGCGVELDPATGAPSICEDCAKVWTRKHRRAFALGCARTGLPEGGSLDRSTSGSAPKGAGRKRTRSPTAA